MRYIKLTEVEKQNLENLHKSSNNFVVRDRCLCLLLSDQGHSMAEISRKMKRHWHTIEKLFSRWNLAASDDRFSALYSAKGQGAKVKLKPVAELLPDLVEKHSRNLKLIIMILEKKHAIKVSKQTLQNFLKESGL